MKKFIIFWTIISFLTVLQSSIFCQKTNANNKESNQNSTILKITAINDKMDSLQSYVEKNNSNLAEREKEVYSRIDAKLKPINQQVDLAQTKITGLSDEIAKNTNSIASVRKSVTTSDWTQRGMFWSSIVLILITIMATYLNYRIFRAQTDPDVIVYSMPDPKRSTIINLIIENIGKGVAKNISFSSNNPIPCRAFGMTDQAQNPPTMKAGPFIVGIPELGPNSKRVITWGQYHGLLKGLGDDILEITATYSSRKVFLKTSKFKSIFFLDIKSFEGTDASGEDWDKVSAESLASVASSIKEITTFLKKEKENISI